MIDDGARLGAVTARGGIGFGDLSQVRIFASEAAVGRRAIALRSSSRCAMSRRAGLTELGPDRAALRDADRDAILSTWGFPPCRPISASAQADPALIGSLRAQAGRLFEPGNPAMGAIVTAGPHRVFLSRFGRCEVFQPPPDEQKPRGAAHPCPAEAAAPGPDACGHQMRAERLPCAHLVPAHPLKDAMGNPTRWDEPAHPVSGNSDLVALKADVAALVSGQGPGQLADACRQTGTARGARGIASARRRGVPALPTGWPSSTGAVPTKPRTIMAMPDSAGPGAPQPSARAASKADCSICGRPRPARGQRARRCCQ